MKRNRVQQLDAQCIPDPPLRMRLLQLFLQCKQYGGSLPAVDLPAQVAKRRRLDIVGDHLHAAMQPCRRFSHQCKDAARRFAVAVKQCMARTFQVTHLFPALTVLDNVLLAIGGVRPTKYVMWRFLSSYRDMHDTAQRLLEQAGFIDRKDVEVRNLSHGEQRQLEIVLGLAGDPQILLLDEPAAGLSSGESAEMTRFLTRLDPRLAILLIEHDTGLVMRLSETISVLDHGVMIAEGTPKEIQSNQRVIEAYLGVEEDALDL